MSAKAPFAGVGLYPEPVGGTGKRATTTPENRRRMTWKGASKILLRRALLTGEVVSLEH